MSTIDGPYLESLGFQVGPQGRHPHCVFYLRNYLVDGSWCHASVDHVLWKGEWNWQVTVYGAVHERNAPQGVCRQVRLYNPTRDEFEAALKLMRVPDVRVSRDKRGGRVIS